MSTRRKRGANSGDQRRSPGSKPRPKSPRGSKPETKSTESEVRSNPKLRDLPPNENIQKRADEVYGDTEIPERKPDS
jgi:hypothetical protein